MEPWAEAFRIAQPREFSPREEECLLDGVLGPLGIAQDPIGDGVAEVAVQVDELREGDVVTLSRPFDQPRPHGRFSSGARSDASPTTDGRTDGKVQCQARSNGPVASAPTGSLRDRPESRIIAMMTTLRERVLGGETTFGSWLSIGSPVAAEIAGIAGFDWLVIDTEHGMTTEADVLGQLYAIGTTPATALVRIERIDRLRISRALDLGAGGLVVPRVDGAADVTQALSWMRFPPVGQRGVALGARGQGSGRIGHAEIGSLNDVALGVFQIESASAVADADAIAALTGADVLFVGPADLSHALGVPGQVNDPLYLAALDEVVAACRSHGKAAGILLYDPEAIGPHLERGFGFVGLGSDGGFVMNGARAMLAAAGRG
jgi:4-hydroxy-2-oxoheptanedioate aldolase